MTEVDADADDGADAAEAPPARARGGRRRVLLPAALGAVAVVAVVVAVLQTDRLASRDAEADERDDVARTAGALAEAILSYDHTDIGGSLDRVEELVGGDFADIYEETFRTVQVPVITQLQAVATAEVRRVYVTDVSGGTATAIVLVDQTVESTAGLRTLTGTYLEMELVERDGRWLVEAIPERISSRNETVTPVPGAEPPPSSSPSTTSTPPPSG